MVRPTKKATKRATKPPMTPAELKRRIESIHSELECLIEELCKAMPGEGPLDTRAPDTAHLIEARQAVGGPSGLAVAAAAIESLTRNEDDLKKALDAPDVQRRRREESVAKTTPQWRAFVDTLKRNR